jgi:hypothetical protein
MIHRLHVHIYAFEVFPEVLPYYIPVQCTKVPSKDIGHRGGECKKSEKSRGSRGSRRGYV